LGDPEQCAECCRRGLEVLPDSAQLRVVLGSALLELGDPVQAAAVYRSAVERDPQLPQARYQLGLTLLTLCDFSAGWPLYESRHAANFAGGVSAPLLPMPMWQGEDLTGKSLLVVTEQGYGDHIQFCRMVPLLAERGVRIVLGSSQPLLALMETL